MNLTFKVLTDTAEMKLTEVGAWFHIRRGFGFGSEWVYKKHYDGERLTKVSRSSPTAHRDEVRQWRAMAKRGL